MKNNFRKLKKALFLIRNKGFSCKKYNILLSIIYCLTKPTEIIITENCYAELYIEVT